MGAWCPEKKSLGWRDKKKITSGWYSDSEYDKVRQHFNDSILTGSKFKERKMGNLNFSLRAISCQKSSTPTIMHFPQFPSELCGAFGHSDALRIIVEGGVQRMPLFRRCLSLPSFCARGCNPDNQFACDAPLISLFRTLSQSIIPLLMHPSAYKAQLPKPRLE